MSWLPLKLSVVVFHEKQVRDDSVFWDRKHREEQLVYFKE